MINYLDKDILSGFKNLNEYIKKSNDVERKLRNKYLKLEKNEYQNNVEYIEETLRIELYENKSIEERIKIYNKLLERIKKVVNSKKSSHNFSGFRNINTSIYPKNYDKLVRKYIVNNSSDYEKKLQKHVYNRLLTYLSHFPNKLKGDIIRNRSIVPSLFKRFNIRIMSYINSRTPINNEFVKVMNKVDNLLSDLDGNYSKIQTESVFNTLILYLKINLHKTYKQDKDENIANIKNLLGQDEVVIDYKYAVYMILYGVDHNQPICKI